MSRNRSSRRTRSRGNHITRANNVLVFKLVDPICQSLLFIFFFYCLDSDTDTQYQVILDIIVGWQILSCLVNFLIRPVSLLKRARFLWLITMISYIVLYYFIEKTIPEKTIVLREAKNLNIPLHDMILEAGALIIAFWYYVICFREIRTMLTSVNNNAA